MLKIRLSRTGKRHQPSYRLIVTEARRKRNGQYLENLGYWDPLTDKIKINQKRYQYWLGVGALPTKKVKELYEKTG